MFSVSPAFVSSVRLLDGPPAMWLISLPERFSDALTLLAVKSIVCTLVREATSSVSVIVPEFAEMFTVLLPLPPSIVVPSASDEWSTMKMSSPPPPNR